MDIEFKKAGKSSLGKLGLYTLLLLCIAALGVGSYAAMRSSTVNPSEPDTTVDWDNQGGTVEADKPENLTVEFTVREEITLNPTTSATAKVADDLPFTGRFTLPVGTQILKDYSNGEMVSSKTMGDWRVHNGIDFTAAEESRVLSIQKGKVIAVYEDEMWGTVVEIDHGNNMKARYCGIKNDKSLKAGDTVKNGEDIGSVGVIPVESADELHLHLEITVNDKIVDPLAAMNRGS